jgi:hypothetical protein
MSVSKSIVLLLLGLVFQVATGDCITLRPTRVHHFKTAGEQPPCRIVFDICHRVLPVAAWRVFSGPDTTRDADARTKQTDVSAWSARLQLRSMILAPD